MIFHPRCAAALILCLTFVAVGGVARAAEPMTGGVLSGSAIDGRLDSLDVKLGEFSKNVRAIQDGGASGQICRQSLANDAILKDPAAIASLSKAGRVNASHLATCRAYKTLNVGVCTALGAAAPGRSSVDSNAAGHVSTLSGDGSADDCRDLYWEMIRTKILFTASSSPAEAQRMCVMMESRPDNSDFSGGVDVRAFCELYVRYASDARERVAQLAPIVLRTSKIPPSKVSSILEKSERRESYSQGLGSAADCAELKSASAGAFQSREACTMARSYRAAYKSKNPVNCGDSGLCLAMMDTPDACDRYSRKLGDEICAKGGALADSFVQVKRHQLVDGLTEVQRSIDQLGISSGLSAERRSRIVAMKKRCQTMIQQAYGPVSVRMMHHKANSGSQR